jgi:hypothetical protein
MANKSRKPPGSAGLQELTLVPITDPAEQAALEERIRQANDVGAAAVDTRDGIRVPQTATPPQVVALCRRLSPEERFALLTQMADELPADQQLALVKRFRVRSTR